MKKQRSTDSKTDAPGYVRAKAEMMERERALRQANARLAKHLDAAKAKTGDLVDAIYQAMTDAVGTITIPPVKAPKLQRSKKSECAIITMGDAQFGKATPSYSLDIAGRRLVLYTEKIQLLTDIQRSDHAVPDARVYLLGDMVEGEIIFPHQPHQIDSSLFVQITQGAEILAKFLLTLLTIFGNVHAVGIVGNHGRFSESKRYSPESNADRVLYYLTKVLLQNEPRLTWTLPFEKGGEAWYNVDYPFIGLLPGVDGPGFLTFHGDEIPGSASHSVGTIGKHIYGYASGAVPEPFQYAIYGHWHTARRYRLNKFIAWCNGSLESGNRFAQRKYAAVGYPEQLLLFAHPRGVTAEYWVDLGEHDGR